MRWKLLWECHGDRITYGGRRLGRIIGTLTVWAVKLIKVRTLSSGERLDVIIRARVMSRIQKEGRKHRSLQTYGAKKYKTKDWEINRSEGRKGGKDAWRYVKHVAKPILWPECRKLTEIDLNTVLEDNAPAYKVGDTNGEREKEGIKKANWPSRSPDFNPIEHIWNWMRREIDRRNDVATVNGMNKALREMWEELSIDRINDEVKSLPHITAECVLKGGGTNFPD
jgi:hypothetical protein